MNWTDLISVELKWNNVMFGNDDFIWKFSIGSNENEVFGKSKNFKFGFESIPQLFSK